ncbi:FecCD family ABC transporter permease [Sandaracinobacteroides saxicola]|uniref:Iron ABC transporter permease n=1 Tax=Sandaracinobacteroides saxicola TaxID=2759707 RepID=A0A7G5IKN7_9SPHN|nr:iron ABC transporter permease [Sandaracinobacteroides saxicola]QMW23929.1 iron ABC transporter permease [Sandaracinobacteroides saxicola]
MTRLPLLLALALPTALALSLLTGKVWLPPADWLTNPTASLIILELRLPRTLLAAAIGAALGLSGAVMQGYLRNPLADPGLFGVSSSAALGAVATLFLALGAAALPFAALAGAALGMAALTLIAGRHSSLILFTLAGLILSSLTGALTTLLISLAPTPFATTEIVTWLIGALTDRSWNDVRLTLPLLALGMAILALTARGLDALTLGESVARSLGTDMARLQSLVILGVGLCVGASVAAAGIIGFVGLVVPHLVRPLMGERPSAILLPSALAGALLLLLADTAVRALPTVAELRLGVAMSLLGAPFFLALLWRLRRSLA